jgi:hypothetical protein
MMTMSEVDRPIIDMTLDKKRSTKKVRVYSGGKADSKAQTKPKHKTAQRPSMIEGIKIGRPAHVLSQDMKDDICELIATGSSVYEISRIDGMPTFQMIFKHVARDAAFGEQYMRAREKQQFALADRAMGIAAGTDPLCFRTTPDGATEMLDATERRLVMDTLRWQAGKLAARVFGDRVAVTGADGGAVQIEATRKVDLASLPPDQLAQFEAMLRALPKPSDESK